MKQLTKALFDNPIFALPTLLLFGLTFFLGTGMVHLFDWDEINFAESAREMLLSQNHMQVQIGFEPFWEKPPLFTWLQTLSMKIFGINEFAARFPNGLFGILSLFTVYFIGKKHHDSRLGMLWALLYVGSLLPHLYFKSGIIDPVFNFFIFLSLYFVIRSFNGDRKPKTKNKFYNKKYLRWALLAGLVNGLAIITKGPVAFLLVALTFIVYLLVTKFKRRPTIAQIGLFAFGVLFSGSIWFGLDIIQNGPDTFYAFVRYQIELFGTGVAGHEQPWYYHILVLFFGCFPMSILAIHGAFRYDETNHDLKKWLNALFWVVLLIFSLATTKIVHYSSMCYLPLAYLAALQCHRWSKEPVKLPIWLRPMLAILGIITGLAVAALPLLAMEKNWLAKQLAKNDPFAAASFSTDVLWNGWEWIFGVVLLLGFILLVVKLKKNLIGGVLAVALCTTISFVGIMYHVLPKIEAYTQGPAIRFYEQNAQENVYLIPGDGKSYAHVFYGQFKQEDIKTIRSWPGTEGKTFEQILINNPNIDKPVLMVTKSTFKGFGERPDIKKIGAEGGFIFWRREVR